MNAPSTPINDLPLTKLLKANTTSTHDSVDNLVMGADPFSNLTHYEKFLRLQHRFHGTINALYYNEVLNNWLPGLSNLQRFDRVKADLLDLGFNVPPAPKAITLENNYQALGWLYCSEGSNLGAAFLFKETQKIGLGADKGARHLAAHPDGRAPHWREFVALLNGLNLSEEQRLQAVDGAHNAFAFYKKALAEIF